MGCRKQNTWLTPQIRFALFPNVKLCLWKGITARLLYWNGTNRATQGVSFWMFPLVQLPFHELNFIFHYSGLMANDWTKCNSLGPIHLHTAGNFSRGVSLEVSVRTICFPPFHDTRKFCQALCFYWSHSLTESSSFSSPPNFIPIFLYWFHWKPNTSISQFPSPLCTLCPKQNTKQSNICLKLNYLLLWESPRPKG